MSHHRKSAFGATEMILADFGGYLSDPVIHGTGRMQAIRGRGALQGVPEGMGDIWGDIMSTLDQTWVQARDAAVGTATQQIIQSDAGQQALQLAQQQAEKSILTSAGEQMYAKYLTTKDWVVANPGKAALIAGGTLGAVALVVYLAVRGAVKR